MIKNLQLIMAILSALFFLNNGFAQSVGKIKKHHIRIAKTTYTDSLGNSKIESIEKYDAKGNLIYIEEYNKKGLLKKKQSFVYNKKKQLISFQTYNEEGLVIEDVKISYQLDLPVKYDYFDAQKSASKTLEIRYNAFEEKTDEYLRDPQGKLIEHTQYEYDNKGLKTKKTVFNAAGKIIETKNYSYEFE